MIKPRPEIRPERFQPTLLGAPPRMQSLQRGSLRTHPTPVKDLRTLNTPREPATLLTAFFGVMAKRELGTAAIAMSHEPQARIQMRRNLKRMQDPERWRPLPLHGQGVSLARSALNAELLGNEGMFDIFYTASLARLDEAAFTSLGALNHIQAARSWRIGGYLAWHFGDYSRAHTSFSHALRATWGGRTPEGPETIAQAIYGTASVRKAELLQELYEVRGDLDLDRHNPLGAIENYQAARLIPQLYPILGILSWAEGEITELPRTPLSPGTIDAKLSIVWEMTAGRFFGDPPSIEKLLAKASAHILEEAPEPKWRSMYETLDKRPCSAITILRLSELEREWLGRCASIFRKRGHIPSHGKGNYTGINLTMRVLLAREFQEMEKQQWSPEHRPLDLLKIPMGGWPRTQKRTKTALARITADEAAQFQKLCDHYSQAHGVKSWLMRALITRVATEMGWRKT